MISRSFSSLQASKQHRTVSACSVQLCSNARSKVSSVHLSQRATLHTSRLLYAPETIKVPQMAESISEGTLKTWLKKPGDWVEADEEIASIETDKIDVSINAPKAGKLVETLAKEDDTVAVGQDLYTLDPDASKDGGESSSGKSETPASPPKQDEKEGKDEPTPAKSESSSEPAESSEPAGEAETIKVPQMAESISEGTLKTWMKKVGDYVEADEEIASIETDKIDVTINAPKAGTITEILAKEDETVAVGQDLYKLTPGKGGKSKDSPKPQPTDDSSSSGTNKGRKGSSSRDEIQNKESEPKRAEPKVQETKQPKAQPDAPKKESSSSGKESKDKSAPAAGSRNDTRVKMNAMRKRIAERLKQSQNAAASLTTFNEIDMSSLMQMRSQYKDQILKDHGVKLGFMSAFARASCLALKEIPAANASIEGPGPGEQIVYRDYVDLSVAVSTPKGLVTPVVRNAENMSFLEIEQAIAALGKKARDGKLTLEDMAGGSFTISNGGVFGSLYGTPIINLPQAAVLGMHSIKDKPYVVNGKIEIRPIMVVALTYDHRLLDGREAVTFLVRIKQYIEDPRLMLLA